LVNFLEDQAVKNINEAEKLVVHCSAGVGRSGTVIGLINSIMTIKHSTVISIFSIMRRIRE